MGEQATSFLAVKARLNFSAMERAQSKDGHPTLQLLLLLGEKAKSY